MHLGLFYFYQLIFSRLCSCLVFSYSRSAVLRPVGDLPPKYGVIGLFSFIESNTGAPCNIFKNNNNWRCRKIKFLGSRRHRPTHRLNVSVHSGSISADNPHYTNISDTSISISKFKLQRKDDEDEDEGESQEEKYVPGTDPPAGEDFFKRTLAYLQDKELQKQIDWRHPMPCSLSQIAAFSTVKELMPPSMANTCFNVTDGTDLDELLGKTRDKIYNKVNIEAFFRFEPSFGFERDGTDVFPEDPEFPLVKQPHDAPIFEGEKGDPSIPLGWRTFAVLAMLPYVDAKADPSLLWNSQKTAEGQLQPRLASGLFKYGPRFNFVASRDAINPEGYLLHSKDPVRPGELFRGNKGDLSSVIITDPPRECSTISKDLYTKRFSEDGIWPKKCLDNVLSTLTPLQVVWAKLSTSMMHSTAKIIRFYRLAVRKFHEKEIFSRTNRLNIDEIHKSESKKGAIDVIVGNMYFMAAPTLHHAVQLVRSDPMARANIYKNLLIFEAEDALKNQFLEKRHRDYTNPRQYLVFGRYNMDSEYAEIMRERMTRFLIRSNCVRTYATLKAPRKDSLVDFKLPTQQLLPVNNEYIDLIVKRDIRFRDACLTHNETEPIGDMSIINQFDYDDALDWANRIPYTRSGTYDTLFVARADEVAFYGRNCKYTVPLPMKRSFLPLRQEYITVKFDPLATLSKRMTTISGHIIALPKSETVINNVNNEKTNDSHLYDKNKQPEKTMDSWPNRLFITIKTTYPEKYKPANFSHIYAEKIKLKRSCVSRFKSIPLSASNSSHFNVSFDRFGWKEHTESTRKSVYCDIQTTPWLRISFDALEKLLQEDAPKELDRPFYADLLKDYVYLSLPEGHFFLPKPGYTNDAWSGNDDELVPPASAEDICRLREYKPEAISGIWIRKKECFLLYNNPQERYLLFGKRGDGKDTPITDKDFKNVIIKTELVLDLFRKGGNQSLPRLTQAYSRKDGKLVSHLSEEEKMKTAYSVDPLNRYFAKYKQDDDLPACRFYERGLTFSPYDPRYLMGSDPGALYQLQLEFIEKLDRGLVSIDDDPVKIMVEADHYKSLFKSNCSAVKWEDYDTELIKRKDVKKANSTKT
ncbi:hypothetical protein BEWA_021270 [Theileria equi strain WA]|uniref:Uncharacterized protein n=1 Tax=Theileria equi strain WA TaxID=1537102 RepID=L0AWJ0_THEEQ|nr:hypothetical protein BEWA_021270 [Theileria equi strain WA]AFZ79279.1 hypothetical protein BEWA_021270 [Theileria equi strain WA]|eukprot:XP_004828945.1 hypothetical protein BEWA_021270 [Theileria equi strain WA]